MSSHPTVPTGQTRVSSAVFDLTATVAAGEVQGVLSVESLARGAAIGGAIGGAIGLVQSGPMGAAVGASVGTAAGAAVGHALRERQRREAFATVDRAGGPATAPDLHIAIVARYGEDLTVLARRVRDEVEGALLDVLGLRPGAVTVEVVDVVSPEAEYARLPPPEVPE